MSASSSPLASSVNGKLWKTPRLISRHSFLKQPSTHNAQHGALMSHVLNALVKLTAFHSQILHVHADWSDLQQA